MQGEAAKCLGMALANEGTFRINVAMLEYQCSRDVLRFYGCDVQCELANVQREVAKVASIAMLGLKIALLWLQNGLRGGPGIGS